MGEVHTLLVARCGGGTPPVTPEEVHLVHLRRYAWYTGRYPEVGTRRYPEVVQEVPGGVAQEVVQEVPGGTRRYQVTDVLLQGLVSGVPVPKDGTGWTNPSANVTVGMVNVLLGTLRGPL